MLPAGLADAAADPAELPAGLGLAEAGALGAADEGRAGAPAWPQPASHNAAEAMALLRKARRERLMARKSYIKRAEGG